MRHLLGHLRWSRLIGKARRFRRILVALDDMAARYDHDVATAGAAHAELERRLEAELDGLRGALAGEATHVRDELRAALQTLRDHGASLQLQLGRVEQLIGEVRTAGTAARVDAAAVLDTQTALLRGLLEWEGQSLGLTVPAGLPGEARALMAAVTREAGLAFSPEPSEYLQSPPYVRVGQLDTLPIRGTRVGILAAFPRSYAELVAGLEPAAVLEIQLASAAGPCRCTRVIAGTESGAAGAVPIGLGGITTLLDVVEYLWIPDPYLASIVVRSFGLLSQLGPFVTRAFVFSLPVRAASIFASVAGAGPKPEPDRFPLVHDDNSVRAMLHRSGFLEVARVGAASGERKTTRYHETKPFYLVERPTIVEQPADEEALLEVYVARKLPSGKPRDESSV